jgi:hypothetical protein
MQLILAIPCNTSKCAVVPCHVVERMYGCHCKRGIKEKELYYRELSGAIDVSYKKGLLISDRYQSYLQHISTDNKSSTLITTTKAHYYHDYQQHLSLQKGLLIPYHRNHINIVKILPPFGSVLAPRLCKDLPETCHRLVPVAHIHTARERGS